MAERDRCTMYTFSPKDVDAVNIVSWYEKFKELTPKTNLIPIPPDVLKYLKADGLMMPEDTHTTAHYKWKEKEDTGNDNSSWVTVPEQEEPHMQLPTELLQQLRQQSGHPDAEEFDNDNNKWEVPSSNSGSESGEDSEKTLWVEKFHEFDAILEAAIIELGGAVLPKINRKSPKDAVWIGFNRSLKSYSPGDIYLLLKTSDVVGQVLNDPYKGCQPEETAGAASSETSPYFLVLRKWEDGWGPEMEFRCFICANKLIAICQRDVDTCYSSIGKRKDKILVNIQNFFVKNIQQRIPLDYYVMDIVYHPNGEIYITDFDVFGLVTDPLLFTYEELETLYGEVSDNGDNSHCAAPNVDNRLREMSKDSDGSTYPCLRFLTESETFRGRKPTDHSTLVSDVMTYMRHCLTKN